MIKLTITGAAGRMGRELIRLIHSNSEYRLVGAIESKGHKGIGADAGINAGIGRLDIPINDDLSQVSANTDVVIDFSTPEATMGNAPIAVHDNCGVVIGTTGFSDHEKATINELTKKGGRIVFAPNMSIGVNLLFLLCKHTVKILGEEYDVEIIEMHHKHKKDAPSGTAVKLGEVITSEKGLRYDTDIRHGRCGMVGERTQREVGMHSMRGGDVVGDHRVIFAGEGERVELVHKASSRITFVKGALRAAKFLSTANSGLYSMEDVLGLTDSC